MKAKLKKVKLKVIPLTTREILQSDQMYPEVGVENGKKEWMTYAFVTVPVRARTVWAQ